MREVAPGLWIGNALEARDVSAVLSVGVEAIVDLAAKEPPITATRDIVCCRIPVADGQGNPIPRIQLAIETVRRLVVSRIPTLVACSAGMSRSPLIAAAALARKNDASIEDMLSQVTTTGPCDVSPALFADVITALDDLRE